MRWSLFFLISVGRGTDLQEVTPGREREAHGLAPRDREDGAVPGEDDRGDALPPDRDPDDARPGDDRRGDRGDEHRARLRDPRRQRDHVRQLRRRHLPVRLPPRRRRQRPPRRHRRGLPAQPALHVAARRGGVQGPLRPLRVRRPLRRLACPRVHVDGRPARERPALPVRPAGRACRGAGRGSGAAAARRAGSGPDVHVVVVGGGITGLAAAYAPRPGRRRRRPCSRRGPARREGPDARRRRVRRRGGAGLVHRGAARRGAALPRAGPGRGPRRDEGARGGLRPPRRRGLVPMPDGLALVLPTKFRPFVTTRLFSWPEKMRMGMDLFLPRGPMDGDDTIGALLRRRLGDALVDRLAGPLVGGIYGTLDRRAQPPRGHAQPARVRARAPEPPAREHRRGGAAEGEGERAGGRGRAQPWRPPPRPAPRPRRARARSSSASAAG